MLGITLTVPVLGMEGIGGIYDIQITIYDKEVTMANLTVGQLFLTPWLIMVQVRRRRLFSKRRVSPCSSGGGAMHLLLLFK